MSNVHYAESGDAVVRVVAADRPTPARERTQPTLEDLYLHLFNDQPASGRDDVAAARTSGDKRCWNFSNTSSRKSS